MSQNPTPSTLFVSQLKAGAGIKLTPTNGTGIVTVEADGGGTGAFPVNTAITTVGAGTLTAAAIVGQQITRSGSTAAFSDATDTAAAIVAAIPHAEVGQSFYLTITNLTAFAETITAGGGITLSGFTIVPANSSGLFLVTLTSLAAVSIQGVATIGNQPVLGSQYKAQNSGTGVVPAGNMAGAAICYLSNTNATPGNQTTPTAAALLAAIPGAEVGFSYTLRLINTAAGTWTFVADGSVTLTGTATIAQNVTRDYVITFVTATTATMQSVGSGVSP